MAESLKFNFGDSSIATMYDEVLVPILFRPWASRIIKEHEPWEGRAVLDVATGTGIFAQLAAGAVGQNGFVKAVDINSEMLDLARKRCESIVPEVDFIQSSADSLEIPSGSIDFVVSQQGFQFFPDKARAAMEIYRVLRENGKVYISTWRPVLECQYFGAICTALETIPESEISDMMRLPFDYMHKSDLENHFKSAGFTNVQVNSQEMEFVFSGGVAHAVEVSYATPIRPKLLSLSEKKQIQFKTTFSGLLNELSSDGKTMGKMVANVLLGEK
jgi:ubiquinone/menaquinone biosynthesis C-methylase UbiE